MKNPRNGAVYQARQLSRGSGMRAMKHDLGRSIVMGLQPTSPHGYDNEGRDTGIGGDRCV